MNKQKKKPRLRHRSYLPRITCQPDRNQPCPGHYRTRRLGQRASQSDTLPRPCIPGRPVGFRVVITCSAPVGGSFCPLGERRPRDLSISVSVNLEGIDQHPGVGGGRGADDAAEGGRTGLGCVRDVVQRVACRGSRLFLLGWSATSYMASQPVPGEMHYATAPQRWSLLAATDLHLSGAPCSRSPLIYICWILVFRYACTLPTNTWLHIHVFVP